MKEIDDAEEVVWTRIKNYCIYRRSCFFSHWVTSFLDFGLLCDSLWVWPRKLPTHQRRCMVDSMERCSCLTWALIWEDVGLEGADGPGQGLLPYQALQTHVDKFKEISRYMYMSQGRRCFGKRPLQVCEFTVDLTSVYIGNYGVYLVWSGPSTWEP